MEEMNLIRAEAIFLFELSCRNPVIFQNVFTKFKFMEWPYYTSVTETIYQATFSLMRFTETTRNEANFRDIQSYKNNWKLFHKFTSHNLVICYQTCKISIVEEFPIISPAKILPVSFRAEDRHY